MNYMERARRELKDAERFQRKAEDCEYLGLKLPAEIFRSLASSSFKAWGDLMNLSRIFKEETD